MELHIQEQNFGLSEGQKGYIQTKIEHVLRHLGSLSMNEALTVRVGMTKEDTKSEDDQFFCEVSVVVPTTSKTLHCDVRAVSPEAAIDLCVEKLNKQAEKLKTKVEDHSVSGDEAEQTDDEEKFLKS